MLESYKKSYEDQADLYIKENWREMNKNDLVNKYIEVEDNVTLANAYMCAIIYRYWNSLNNYCLKSCNSVSPEECYGWLLSAILWAVKHRKWKDPNNKLYNDPNGPDKVINRCIFSRRMGFYQSSNTYKRKRNFGLYSLESLMEDYGDAVYLPSPDKLSDSDESLGIYNLTRNAFTNGDYVTAFIIDCIVYGDLFRSSRKKHLRFNKQGLITRLHRLDTTYITRFASTYDLKEEDVEAAGKRCRELSKGKLITVVKRSFKKLRLIYLKASEEYQAI